MSMTADEARWESEQHWIPCKVCGQEHELGFHHNLFTYVDRPDGDMDLVCIGECEYKRKVELYGKTTEEE